MSDPATKDELDWTHFTAAYFPGTRRHDLGALTAYGAYRRAQVNRDRPSETAQPLTALKVGGEKSGPVL
jgi:hypothetical protein